MDIKAEILDYINCNETTGALLLTGPWGCGKSYLAKQIAKDLNEEHKAAVAVISLFGLDSIFAINKRVRDEYINFDIGTVGKAIRKVSKGVGTLAKDGLAVAGTAAPDTVGLSAASQGIAAIMSYDVFNFIEVKNTVGKDKKVRKFVIVFDDLERCGIITPQDLLGAINEYVENKQIKVVIIADEEKIGDKEYKEYKEKLISRTIRMSADYNLLIDSIISNYHEACEGYNSFLIENADILKQVFFESKTSNIRTLKCILADFERVYTAWKDTEVPKENMKWALYTFGAEVYLSKSPKKQEEPSEKQKTTLFSDVKEEQYPNKGKNNSSFYSVNRWIQKGVWDKHEFTDELRQKYTDRKNSGKDETHLYRFLTYRLWDLQQQDITEGLPAAVLQSYEGELTKDQLITLLGKVHALKINDIPIPCEIDYSKIETGFVKRISSIQSGTISEPKSHSFIGKKDVDEDACGLVDKLEKLDDRIVAFENRQKYISYLCDDTENTYYSLKGLCVEEFDAKWLELFIKKYTEVDNSEKRELLISLLGITYDCDQYSTEENIKHTKLNFEKLAAFLNTMETNDGITKAINKAFEKSMKEKFGIE